MGATHSGAPITDTCAKDKRARWIKGMVVLYTYITGGGGQKWYRVMAVYSFRMSKRIFCYNFFWSGWRIYIVITVIVTTGAQDVVVGASEGVGLA